MGLEIIGEMSLCVCEMPQLHCSDGGIETLRTEMPQEAVLMVLRFLFRKCFVSFIVDSGTEKVILLFLGFKQR